jgi:hypothetical protein
VRNVFDASLARQVETWKKYWANATDPEDVKGQLRKLRWLEEFVFHCGPEISRHQYKALEMQIEAGEAKLAELSGDVPKTRSPAPSQPSDYTSSEAVKNGGPETLVFGASA